MPAAADCVSRGAARRRCEGRPLPVGRRGAGVGGGRGVRRGWFGGVRVVSLCVGVSFVVMSALEKQLHLGRLPPRPPLPGGGGQSGSKMRMGRMGIFTDASFASSPKLLCYTGVFSSMYVMMPVCQFKGKILKIPLSDFGGFFLSCSPGRKRDFSPVLWSQYFESMEDVVVENETGKDISFFLD
ncbi:hypothetical protein QYF61_005949 [Mycteria americana]|uniref:Uncharacterized protein n=1 Tax=Mycteria americana TaxID=33587 RepID=A0AAN7PWM3_MYCAM|nr:hypothetical protein QYF61_005949 [Mycteria americana]